MEPLHIVMTGGHSGIGLELTTKLASEGHQITLVVRSEDRLAEVRSRDIKTYWIAADLSNQDEVRVAGAELSKRLPKIDILVNSAGVLLGDLQHSSSGNEMHYEVNTLAPLVLAAALRDRLASSPRARVLNVVSDNMDRPTEIDFETLHNPTKITKLTGSYQQSKLALTHATAFLAPHPGWSSVIHVSATPGANKTAMTAGPGMPALLKPLRNRFFAEPTKGAGLLSRALYRKDLQSGEFLRNDKVRPLSFELDPDGFDQVIKGLDAESRKLVAEAANSAETKGV